MPERDRQYGGGGPTFKRRLQSDEKAIAEREKERERQRGDGGDPTFPSAAEIKYLHEQIHISSEPSVQRENPAYLSSSPICMRFKDLCHIGDTQLHEHVAKIIDIYIRWVVMKAGGDLKKSKLWILMEHEGYSDKNGLCIHHRTYSNVDGEVVTNMIAKQMQSNNELALDDTFTLSMNVFKNEEGRHTGRGVTVRGVNSLRAKMLKSYFGINKERILGDSHCLIKAVVLGKMTSNIQMCQDPVQKNMLENTLRNCTTRGRAPARNQLEEAKNFLRELGIPDGKEAHQSTTPKYLYDFPTLVTHMCPDCQ